ncbi:MULTISPECIES: hypothetical protein [Pseudoalteromonas]|uniref:hypothetical protein n=1 Tax=Pseudoalteromonas TaxID=53246 RepID=UPI000FFE8821|nr:MULTISPECIES: hypothetical protein [Pseudoalteromonas]MCG9759302.1 hypothetical protein [Pseudoalteromonas sp. Isolate6]NKC21070.1 hypothetical protein [Pseudoalteromonas galatheae]RXE87760.1 hypothetical protein DRB05_06080 [Pseudoalteromonas sp. A757]
MNVNFLIHSPTQLVTSHKEQETKAEKVEELKPLRLSEEDLSKLSGEEVREEQEEAALPPHIQQMVEKLKELREKIKEEQKLLEELKASDQYADEMKAELITQKLEYILRMQSQVIELTKNIQEAMKEAGISDPGVLLKALA